jgi:hypothetical protein
MLFAVFGQCQVRGREVTRCARPRQLASSRTAWRAEDKREVEETRGQLESQPGISQKIDSSRACAHVAWLKALWWLPARRGGSGWTGCRDVRIALALEKTLGLCGQSSQPRLCLWIDWRSRPKQVWSSAVARTNGNPG